MFGTLKILCILLKVLMLTRTALAVSLENEDIHIVQNTPSFEFYTINNYLLRVQKLYMQEYFNNITEKNVVVLKEDSTLYPGCIPNESFPLRTFVEFNNRLTKKNISVTLRSDEFKNQYIILHMNYVQYWSEDLKSNDSNKYHKYADT
ncbi:uncharacterized protein LOC114935067 [Nylanderia fulva]|uniref:uncharacterized protein LOC114935067 n=1 Tax=Nylanderia fulva TaxID=613905 RepID=UPI0010FB871F|nr:uncharacterized protein LOC114935067 [Nylanderia fulva]